MYVDWQVQFSRVSRCDVLVEKDIVLWLLVSAFIMPLFGKKTAPKTVASPKDANDKKSSKVPTVEDKYIMKDVLGT